MVSNIKSIIAFCIIMHLSLQLFCQGNLQFNRVVQESFSMSVLASVTPQTITTFTVPSGKVWKIESGSVVGGLSGGSLNGFIYSPGPSTSLLINNHCIYKSTALIGSSTVSESIFQIDHLWLNEGSYTLYCQHAGGSIGISPVSTNLRIGYSGIEFNIIP